MEITEVRERDRRQAKSRWWFLVVIVAMETTKKLGNKVREGTATPFPLLHVLIASSASQHFWRGSLAG